MWLIYLSFWTVRFKWEFCHFEMILFASEIPSDKKFFDKEKNEKKRKPYHQVVEIGQARFLRKKYYPIGWRFFFSKPVGLDLDGPIVTTYFCFLFYSFLAKHLYYNLFKMIVLLYNCNGVNTSRKKINYTLFVRWVVRCKCSNWTEWNDCLGMEWSNTVCFCRVANFAIFTFLQSFIALGKAYGLRNGIVRWVSWNVEKALLLLAN